MCMVAAVTLCPNADADNSGLNNGVVSDVYTIQHQVGCRNDVRADGALTLAAQWHTDDVLNNRSLDGDIGSDGSTVQDRANAAGYRGTATESVANQPGTGHQRHGNHKPVVLPARPHTVASASQLFVFSVDRHHLLTPSQQCSLLIVKILRLGQG